MKNAVLSSSILCSLIKNIIEGGRVRRFIVSIGFMSVCSQSWVSLGHRDNKEK